MIERRNDHEGAVIMKPSTVYWLDTGWACGQIGFVEGHGYGKDTAPVFRKLCSQGEEALKKLAKAHGWTLKELDSP